VPLVEDLHRAQGIQREIGLAVAAKDDEPVGQEPGRDPLDQVGHPVRFADVLERRVEEDQAVAPLPGPWQADCPGVIGQHAVGVPDAE